MTVMEEYRFDSNTNGFWAGALKAPSRDCIKGADLRAIRPGLGLDQSMITFSAIAA